MGFSRIKVILTTFETNLCDSMLGIHTLGVRHGARPDGSEKADSEVYHSRPYSRIWQILRPVPLGLTDVFFDIGCGAGRVLCVVARKRISRCVGLELSKPLCELAAKNVASLRGRRTPVEIVCVDAAFADYDHGTVYFLFNPFGPSTLKEVIKRIYQSTVRNPRNVRIVYLNPTAAHVIESSGWLRLVCRRTFLGSPTVCNYYDNQI